MRYFALILIFISSFSLALDFEYKGKPIDPNCILESNIEREINLKKCSRHLGKKITQTISADDTFGYQYTENNIPGYISYKYLGKVDDDFVVHASATGGSVSRLDFINYFKIVEDKLILVKRGPSGDRSNGGISNARVVNGKIAYDLALTPLLFMVNFNHLEKRDNPVIEKLPDCAVCQFAKVHFFNSWIATVSLNSEVNTNNKCLDKLHAEYKEKEGLKLTAKEAEEFAQLFLERCTK